MSAFHYIFLAAMLLESSVAVAGEEAAKQTDEVTTASPELVRQDDQITLKSGRVLAGGKIVRITPFRLFFEVIPSIEPLEIPARQVAAISYGQEESKERDTVVEPAESEDETIRVLQATKISPDLVKRMTSPITDEVLNFNEQDLVNTLRSVGILSEVSVSFGPELESIPPEERTFSVRLEPGISFEEFFRDTLAPQAPWINMEYRFDTVHFERN